jgi:hypothetical protein
VAQRRQAQGSDVGASKEQAAVRPGWPVGRVAQARREAGGVVHHHFGVDYPFETCKQQVEQASGIKLRNADKFYELNARKVFKL